MVNRLVEADNNLPQLDYSYLLEAILSTINQQNPGELFAFKGNLQRLIIKTEAIATLVAQTPPRNPILGQEVKVRTASVNFSAEFRQKFPDLILQIKQALQQKLETFLTGHNLNRSQLVEELTTPLSSFKSSNANLSLSYPFDKNESLTKQRLTIQRDRLGSKSTLKFHKLTITINNTNQFEQNLQQGLSNYFEDYQDQEVIEEILSTIPTTINNTKTDIFRLKKLVDTEFLGQLKREASITYLEYIKGNIDTEKYSDIYYLHDLIRRLKLIDGYLNNPHLSDEEYKFYYQGVEIDLRQLLSRAEAFECLPIIPIVGGYLGETTDKHNGKRQFIFGLKLKLNGKVQSKGKKSSFAYHMDLINPESEEYKKELENNNDQQKAFFIRKLFKTFFLYYIIYTSNCQPGSEKNPNPEYCTKNELHYHPLEHFQQQVIPILRKNDDEEKRQLLSRFYQAFVEPRYNFRIEEKINRLVKLLKNFLKHSTILTTQEYNFHIGVHRAILENDPDVIAQRDTLFKEILRQNPKQSLQYISIREATINKDIICQLPASIKIEDIRYQQDPEQQTLTSTHEVAGIKAIPVVLASTTEEVRQAFSRDFKDRKALVCTHEIKNKLHWKNQDYFNYYFSLFFLQYMVLKVILEPCSSDLFLPVVRLQNKNRQNKKEEAPDKDIDKDIANYSKALAHLLNQDYLSNSQGFDISKENGYKYLNGLTSLYSVLPKKFRFSDPKDIPHLDKLVIIIVSSRESDAKKGNEECDQRLANVLGEVISFNRLQDGTVLIKTEKSFGDNYPVGKLYDEPTIISDTVTNLYGQGYRHFLYVAKAPYSSTLNITTAQTDEDDGLYFHSQKLVTQLCKNKSQIKLYPIFYDQYFVRKLSSNALGSFYLQDSEELTDLVNDPSQYMMVFLNLFNGVDVVGSDGFYNGVTSYATLINTYDRGFFDQQHILFNLLSETDTKKDILQYLALFHFYRCEKGMSPINLKLDPYENIIGDESLAKKAIFKHGNAKSDFNLLAFLTEVAKVLRGLDQTS